MIPGELVYYFMRSNRLGGAYRAEILEIRGEKAKIFLIADIWGELFDPNKKGALDYTAPDGTQYHRYPKTVRTVKINRIQVIKDNETLEKTRKLREEAYRLSSPSNQKTRKKSRRKVSGI